MLKHLCTLALAGLIGLTAGCVYHDHHRGHDGSWDNDRDSRHERSRDHDNDDHDHKKRGHR